MIANYHRPTTLDEALTLLAQPNTVPLGGGTLLSHTSTSLSAGGTVDPVSVVDLQSLGLNTLARKGNDLEIGATVTLQQLLESEHCPEALKTAIKLEAPINIRNAATVAGTLVMADGRSTFAASLLALDVKITVITVQSIALSKVEGSVLSVGEFLPLRPRGLITQITVPLQAKFTFEYVSRTPSDKPIVCAALAQWSTGRARLVLGGWGKSPTLAMDGAEADGLDASTSSAQAAARNACHEAADDFGSAEYRMDVAATLARRCLENLG